jgi:hypothetical protein
MARPDREATLQAYWDSFFRPGHLTPGKWLVKVLVAALFQVVEPVLAGVRLKGR